MLWLVLPVLVLAVALAVLWARLRRRHAAALAEGNAERARLQARLELHRQRLTALARDASPDALAPPQGDGAPPALPAVPKPERRTVRRRSGPSREPRPSSGS